MKYFILETNNDEGTLFLKTNASSKDAAITNFCNLYYAPINSVINVYEIDLIWFSSNSKWLIKKNLAKLV
jgi:hypothetical protein